MRIYRQPHCHRLLEQGFEVVSIDSLERSQAFVAGRVEEISGKPFHQYSFDCRDEAAVRKVFFFFFF